MGGWLFVGVLIAAVSVQGQQIDTQRAAEMCNSGEYRCGEGWGDSPDEAREAARHELITGIQVLVTSTSSHDISETETALTEEYRRSDQVLSVMQLDGLEYRELPKRDGQYRYLAFVAEKALQASMLRQRQRVRSMVGEALEASAQARLDDALRLSYWAYLLAHTVDTLAIDWPGVTLTDPRLALLEAISHMVGQVHFQAALASLQDETIGISVQVTHDGRPATLDFSLYTGAGMDYPHVADGRGYIELHWNPADLSSSQQRLHLQLLYAYEGRMRHFPEIEALHEVSGDQPLDTYVEVEVSFPFVAESTPASPAPSPPPTTERPPRLDCPLPIRILAGQTETTALLEGLQAYVRNRRLQYYARRPSSEVGDLYVAVVTEEQVLGVFRADAEGYLEVRRQQRLDILKQSEFAGARLIWIVPSQP